MAWKIEMTLDKGAKVKTLFLHLENLKRCVIWTFDICHNCTPSQKQNQMAYGELSLTGLKISNGVLFELAHLLSRFYASYGSQQQRGISHLQYDIGLGFAFWWQIQILIIFGCHQKFSMAVVKERYTVKLLYNAVQFSAACSR